MSSKTTYRERLAAANLDTLEFRRLRFVLIMCCKIVFGLINVECKKFIQFVPASSTRGHCYKLFVEWTIVVTDVITFFASRVVPVWNSLPSNIVNFSTFPKFKTNLFLVDLSKFLKYQLD